jgi:hypothetical protein
MKINHLFAIAKGHTELGKGTRDGLYKCIANLLENLHVIGIPNSVKSAHKHSEDIETWFKDDEDGTDIYFHMLMGLPEVQEFLATCEDDEDEDEDDDDEDDDDEDEDDDDEDDDDEDEDEDDEDEDDEDEDDEDEDEDDEDDEDDDNQNDECRSCPMVDNKNISINLTMMNTGVLVNALLIILGVFNLGLTSFLVSKTLKL